MSKPTRKQLEDWNREFARQAELDRWNIHNKLGEPERQPNESVTDYETRLRKKQLKQGYEPTDFVMI